MAKSYAYASARPLYWRFGDLRAIVATENGLKRVSLRDLLLFVVMLILVPKIVAHPYVGVLAWTVFGVLNPHRLTWGAAYEFQFSLVIAVLTAIGLLVTKDQRQIKGGAPALAFFVLILWITFTQVLPVFNPEDAYAYWVRVIKVFLMTGVMLLVLHTPRHVELLVWMIVVSLGFYGVKGGIFTIVTGGQFMVNGPEGSAMEGNNSLAVGLAIVIPLMVHLFQQYRHKWLRMGLAGAAVLCAISILGSYSRGALLAVFAMGTLLWWRSGHKMVVAVPIVLFVIILIPAMPSQWHGRMDTIQTYEADSSAKGRLVAWETAYNIAKDKFPIGGGFEWQGPWTSAKYSPDPLNQLVAHSIYFQTLGSQGFAGLAIFLLFWWLVWRQCTWVRRKCKDIADLKWAYSLASMTQVGLVGYAVGGAFLDLAFWDVPYYLFAAIACTEYAVKQQIAQIEAGASAGIVRPNAVGQGAGRYRTG